MREDITNSAIITDLGNFDYIFSCSVFEHIHPEEGGDVVASKNVAQLLKPGGVFAFSVPYYKSAFKEYIEGDVYHLKGVSGVKTFFQKFYDEELLNQNIIQPYGLNTLDKLYIGERLYFKKI